VTLADEFIRKSFDMPPHPARICVRVRRDESYAHPGIL